MNRIVKRQYFDKPHQQHNVTSMSSSSTSSATTTTTTTTSGKQTSLGTTKILWSDEVIDDQTTITPVEDHTWITRKTIIVGKDAEFSLKAGNKDFALDLSTSDSKRQKISELSLWKKHG